MFPQVKDRYPYIYLEHGRLEIDDSSVGSGLNNRNFESESKPT